MNKFDTKLNLIKSGQTIKSIYYLLKYSIVFHLSKIGIKIKWSDQDIVINIKKNNKVYIVHTRNNINFIGVFREIYGENQYLISNQIKNIETIVDFGSNIGLFTLYAHSYFPDGIFYCIEPETTNFGYLNKNIESNDINAVLINKAIVPSHKKKVKLYQGVSNTTFATSQTESTSDSFIQVEGITIFELMNNYNIDTIDILKCDIEGAEVELFLEANDDVLKNIKYLYLEYHSLKGKKLLINRLNTIFNIISDKTYSQDESGIFFLINKDFTVL